jgi:protein gp37
VGIKTKIEWCDSSLNLMMGCDGCELWRPEQAVRVCYSGVMTGVYAGAKGWPEAFDKPSLFPERLAPALRWPDLANTNRPDKPWLDGYPRAIFLDDMGDTFTESLAVDWLMPHIEAMAGCPHVWLFLTKRPKRMAQFFNMLGYTPANFWLGTSVTSPATLGRAYDLAGIGGPDTLRWISAEPLWGPLNLSGPLDRIDWVVIGGESGWPAHKPMDLHWARALLTQCQAQEVPAFVKQLGSTFAKAAGGDTKGGDMSYWPEDLRVRPMPTITAMESAPLQPALF